MKRMLSRLLAAALVFSVSAGMVQAQLANNPTAAGVLGQTDFVTKTTGSGATKLNGPNGIALDPATGKIFVVDRGNNRVLRWSSADALMNGSAAEAVIGQPDFVTVSAGVTASKFTTPINCMVDAAGRLWVSDYGNNRVLRFDNASADTTGVAVADGVIGQADFVTGTSGTTINKLVGPVTVFEDNDGRLWVIGFGNHRVTWYNNAAAKANGADADGVLGQPDFATNTSGLTAAKMSSPNSVWVDDIGTLWVTDSGNKRVLRFDSAATKANGANADGVLGKMDFVTNTPGTASQSNLGSLRYVYGDVAGRLYVIGEDHNRILVYNDARHKANGANADYVLGQADFTTSAAANPPTASSFNTPRALAVDSENSRIWVADYNNHRILRFDIVTDTVAALALTSPNGGEKWEVSTNKAITWSAKNIPSVNIDLSTDNGATWTSIAAGVAGNPGWYHWLVPNSVTSRAKVRILPASGPALGDTSAASFIIYDGSAWVLANNLAATSVLGQADFVTKTTGSGATKLNGPNGVTIDPTTGKVFVVDRGNNRVLRWASADALVTGSAAEAVIGQPDFATVSAGVTASNFTTPINCMVDAAGRLWVSDYGNNRVLRFDNASADTSGAAVADGVIGQTDFVTSTSGTTINKLVGPVTVFVDNGGRLWVTGFGNHRVTWYNNAAAKTNGADADGVLGQPDFTTNTSGLTASRMSSPNSVWVDEIGTLWVTDSGNKRVLRFDSAATKAAGSPANGVLGKPDFTTNTPGTASAANLGSLRYVYGDAAGRLYVIGEDHNRILIYNDARHKANGADADYVLGQADFTTSAAANPPTASSFNTPRAIIVDDLHARLFVADYNNHRVLRFDIPRAGTRLLTLNAPNGGEVWSVNSSHAITWSSAGVDSISIAYSTDNGGTWSTVAASLPAVSGSYTWTVPVTPTTQGRVRIASVSGTPVADTSAAAFTIDAPASAVSLVSPNGYQRWETGKVKKILFTSTAISTVKLEYTTNNGTSWTNIATAVAAASGSYSWTVPAALSAAYRVRITDEAAPSVTDTSDMPFAVVAVSDTLQDYVVFNESAAAGYHDPSYATVVTAPSTITNNNTKLPVSAKYGYGGNYAIVLNWYSAVGGSWIAAVANPGWAGQDLNTRDSLLITLFTEDTTKQGSLPSIFVEDLSNTKSTKLPMSNFITSVPSKQWVRVAIPITAFVQNAGSADLTRIKTYFFAQNQADALQNTWYIGDMRLKGGKAISGDSTRVILVLGSSTAAGTGASTFDSSWVGRFRKYVKTQDSTAVVVSLAVGGYTTYDVMPSNFVPPTGRPSPKVNNNITYGLTYKPHAIIVNLPSNDAAYGYALSEQLANYDTILSKVPASVPVWISTTQPRNLDATGRAALIAMKDTTVARYKNRALDFWTGLANADGTVSSTYNVGDGIHINNAGHKLLFDRVIAAGVWNRVLAVEQQPVAQLPTEYRLEQNYPNPFNPSTTIRFALPQQSTVRLTVYNMLGQEVMTLANGTMAAGVHTMMFDARSIASGMYIYRIIAGNFVMTKTMMLIK
jgi:DNA-binding beta-propeller fold protein YncE/lysophospholipase L1-like esterase